MTIGYFHSVHVMVIDIIKQGSYPLM